MLLLEIVTPDGKFYSQEILSIVVRGVEGDLAFMKNMVPLVTALGIGKVRVKYEDGSQRIGTQNEGYVSGMRDKVTLVTDAFEWADEIDEERALAAKQRAEDRISEAPKRDDIDVVRAKAALYRALNRLDVVSMSK